MVCSFTYLQVWLNATILSQILITISINVDIILCRRRTGVLLEIILYQRCNILRNLTSSNFATSGWTNFILETISLIPIQHKIFLLLLTLMISPSPWICCCSSSLIWWRMLMTCNVYIIMKWISLRQFWPNLAALFILSLSIFCRNLLEPAANLPRTIWVSQWFINS